MEAPRRRVPPARHRLALVRLLTFVVAFAGVTGAGAVLAGGASANGYTGLLAGGTVGVNVPAYTALCAGCVYEQDSWSAPSGVQFGGFAYTGATFWVQNFDLTGGISAGFHGSGGNAPADLNFPWTTDCSISEDDSPRTWINSGRSVSSSTKGPYSSTNGYCGPTGGNTSGWNLVNAEVESTNPAINPQATYQTLTLSVWCARDASCNNDDSGDASVTNLSGNFDDAWDTPSGSASWNIGVSGSSWYQTDSGAMTLNTSATDPAGVCSMSASISGPQSVGSGALGNQNPGVVSEGSPIGEEFAYGTNPCWVGQTDAGSWTLPGGLASGTYSASVQASNPGNYQAQGFDANGSPTIASYSNAINVDDTPVSAVLENPTGSGSWTTATTATVDVSTGPSGLGSLTCTDNGSNVGVTLESSSSDTYVYSVPLSSGVNDYTCSAANNDANGALTGGTGMQVYQQDSVVPSIGFSDAGYTAGTWTATQQTITVTATGGPSGITGLSCTLDGNALPDTYGDSDLVGAVGSTQTAFVTVPANGAHNLACSADNAGTPSIVGSGSYQVDVDSQIPVASFVAGSGYAATSTHAGDPQTASGQNWLNGSGTITIGVTGAEPTVDSGVQTITCTINGYMTDPVVLSNSPSSGTIAQNTPFVMSFIADPTHGWIDGQNSVACQSTTLAGLTGADGQNAGTSSIEYVDVNDASWPSSPAGNYSNPTAGQCGISSIIDNGGCAYSDGPSQMTWYSSAQTVQIKADDTGAAAPITSITCTGVTMPVSSWTASADPQDVDSHNGMTVTATIEAPGGKLDCSASDSAGPVDTYELGTYNVSIDPDKPVGYFKAQGAHGAARNILQLDVSSPGGSGIKQVSVQARDQNTGTVYTGGELTGNPADGSTAYATLDPATGTYNLTVDPDVFPGHDDKIAFTAIPITSAGVTATITTADAGLPEVLTPIQLGQNPNPGLVLSTNGDATTITATVRAGKWVAASIAQTGLPASLNGSPTSPVAPTAVATVAKWSRSVCKAATKKQGNRARKTKGKPAKKAPKRSCRTLTSRAPRSEALPANYGQKLEVTGTLTDTTTNAPIAQGTVLMYTSNLATGAVHLAHIARTGTRGRFGYRLAAGPGRRVDLVYLGSDNTKGIDSALDTTTAGKLRVRAARTVRVGQHMRITGRILGGSIDRSGALVQMWYRIEGQKGSWEPFKAGRSSVHGGFVIRYPITAGDTALTYRVRIKVPTQAGWGFRGATSNVLRFHVA